MAYTIHKTGDYQDIREQLRRRLALLDRMAAEAQQKFLAEQEKVISEHKAKMDGFKATAASYRNMLELEESFAKSILQADEMVGPQAEGAEVKIRIPQAKLALPDFLVSQIQARGPLSKEDLRLAAVIGNYFESGESGGRAVHATLMNLLKNKRLTVGMEGLYSVTLQPQETMVL